MGYAHSLLLTEHDPRIYTMPPRILRFAGPSNSGKTTLIGRVLTELQKHNRSCGVLKHSHHELDVAKSKQGFKDGHQLATFVPTLTTGTNRTLIDIPASHPLHHRTPQEWIDFLFPNVDWVLIEGWRAYDFPTILVGTHPADWTPPQTVMAQYTPAVLSNTIPTWSIEDILQYLLHESS